MIPEKLLEIMKQDGVGAIATLGEDGPHMVNTWNSYLRTSEDGRLLIPAGANNHGEQQGQGSVWDGCRFSDQREGRICDLWSGL